jgi:hypothetical protein
VIIDSFENKQKILDNFLKIVAFEDWSKETLILATKNSGIDEKLLPIPIPGAIVVVGNPAKLAGTLEPAGIDVGTNVPIN